MPVIKEIGEGAFGVIKVGTTTVGQFEATSTHDKWKWTSGSWFPSGGFAIWVQSSGTVENPSVVLPAYDFSTTKQVPQPQWSGSAIFELQLGTTKVGWAEVLVSGSNVKMMWWSNGTSLVDHRIACSAGQVLSFTPGSLPTKAQLPLEHTQIS